MEATLDATEAEREAREDLDRELWAEDSLTAPTILEAMEEEREALDSLRLEYSAEATEEAMAEAIEDEREATAEELRWALLSEIAEAMELESETESLLEERDPLLRELLRLFIEDSEDWDEP